eukprot:TRINITY_DN798_c0_g1_i1.p1 TRINITY_DN798_c0_g1~~TRINITY_DN798_c0_g1_i1.p1  ORF type:complete len:496 (-),score=102.51 TRINITY_DN798_c0_g1_i1:153-1640(-)
MFPRKSELPSLAAARDPSLSFDPHNTGFAHWKELAPELHYNDPNFQKEFLKKLDALSSGSEASHCLHPTNLEELKRRMREEGYFQISEEMLGLATFGMSSLVPTVLARSVVQLRQSGWDPTYLNMYDEAWAILAVVSRIMFKVTGNRPNMDMLSWLVDPNQNAKGFSPHRDRQPPFPSRTFYGAAHEGIKGEVPHESSESVAEENVVIDNGGQPHYSTCWIPFTDACPDNSCLYVIPAHHDPGYWAGDTNEDKSPLEVALPNKEDYQHIKCLPAPRGSAIMFSHRIIHWGSAGRKGYHTPRIAFSCAFSADGFEPPYFARTHLPFPPSTLRQSLCAGQMIVYSDRYQFSAPVLKGYYDHFRLSLSEFHQDYRAKVVNEYATVVKNQALVNSTEKSAASLKRARTEDTPSHPSADVEEEEDDDALDDALDAMLQARMDGIDDLPDDFDDEGLGFSADDGEGDQMAIDEEEEDELDEEEMENAWRKEMPANAEYSFL